MFTSIQVTLVNSSSQVCYSPIIRKNNVKQQDTTLHVMQDRNTESLIHVSQNPNQNYSLMVSGNEFFSFLAKLSMNVGVSGKRHLVHSTESSQQVK